MSFRKPDRKTKSIGTIGQKLIPVLEVAAKKINMSVLEYGPTSKLLQVKLFKYCSYKAKERKHAVWKIVQEIQTEPEISFIFSALLTKLNIQV